MAVKDMKADMELRDAASHGGVSRPVGVQLTLLPKWFAICNLRNKKPSVVQVARYWALMQAPEDSMSMNMQMHLIKRAMLEWPKMGAAIAKLAQKQFLQAKKEAKSLKRSQLYKNKKMLREAGARVARADQENHAGDCENRKVQNASVERRVGKKVIKK
jgi:hypothetical protein